MSVRVRDDLDILSIVVLSILMPQLLLASATIGTKTFSVEVNDHGVLIGTAGERIRTVDGPLVQLGDGLDEWFGISYDGPAGRIAAVGIGRSVDWAQREPVRNLSFRATADTATSISRFDQLGLRTHLAFDESGSYLMAEVTLTNLGRETLTNIVYSREWRQAEGGWTSAQNLESVPAAPDDISRRLWRVGSLASGTSTELRWSYETHGAGEVAATVDVPLSLWTNDDFPDGLPLGENLGISWGDYDADGHADLFVCQNATLWRNVLGQTWVLEADLGSLIPPAERRYGSSFGDYNNDGLPDIATEPRVPIWGDDKLHLLKNLGGDANFVDVATDSAIIDVQPYGNSETICWADVNGDRNLDVFIPAYPAWEGGPGNFFLLNQGPTGPGGDYRFTEMSAAAGLDVPPPDSTRPEGAQFVDVDFDGDVDLYSNGTLYQNVSAAAAPAFNTMTEATCGIGLGTSLDEGVVLFDYDLDGDQDLFVVYTAEGVRVWENYGDGSFFAADPGLVDYPFIGVNLGMSAEDWDNDGDIDFTTRQVFRRNRLIEDGTSGFEVATHSIPGSHLTSALPAWGDWDKDGDLDCALGNWGTNGHLYQNTLYGPRTASGDRRHLRIRVSGDSLTVPRGLETEYGATVDVRLLNGPDTFRRRKFVASSHGYLNQNEYTLHFALPDDPLPANAAGDLRFDLVVDFPGLPADGLWRVDKHVNPRLGDIDLAGLTDREIHVFRCGGTLIDGVLHDPLPSSSPRLTTTTGGLALATPTVSLPAPTSAPDSNWFKALAFHTQNATESLRMSEIILDGQLDDPVTCGSETFNLVVWDVTESGNAFIVAGSALAASTSPSNRRSYFPTDVLLVPGRSYRLVARATEFRDTTINAPVQNGPVSVLGGVSYSATDACSGSLVVATSPDPTTTALALRFSAVASSSTLDPIGNTLLLAKDAADHPVLTWQDVSASAVHVRRCDATAGVCTPTFHAQSPLSPYTDTAVTPELSWYQVRAVNECTAGLEQGGP